MPGTVEDWTEIPPVPASAFKRLDLYSGLPGGGLQTSGSADSARAPTPGATPEAVFETSGTREGRARRGRHPVASLELYREASLPWFGRHLVPDGRPVVILALLPSPDAAPSSSLSRMAGFAVEAWGRPGSRFLAAPDTGVDGPAVREALGRAEADGEPTLLLGTAFAWVHWLEWAAAEGYRARLPVGSRLMETGGFKGRSRAVPRADLYRELETSLGVPSDRIVNEYGMTELFSQMYEPVLADSVAGAGVTLSDPARVTEGDPFEERIHRAPPWLGVRALDPDTLDPLPTGETGLLAFMDLANVGSVSAVLTEDRGRLDEDGALRLRGRAPGAEPRGCSLALDGILGAQS